MNFNDLNWHDAIIKNIYIDRNDPGKNDIIKLDIVWNNGLRNNVSFQNVYFANFNINFGIVAPESILRSHSEGRDNYLIKEFYQKWKGLMDNIDLTYFEIETNSTNSRIVIIATDFKITP